MFVHTDFFVLSKMACRVIQAMSNLYFGKYRTGKEGHGDWSAEKEGLPWAFPGQYFY